MSDLSFPEKLWFWCLGSKFDNLKRLVDIFHQNLMLGSSKGAQTIIFGNIFELQKQKSYLTLKMALKWPEGPNFHLPKTEIGRWTNFSSKINPITSKQWKLSSFMTFLKIFVLAKRAKKSKFLIIKKFSRTFFQSAYVSQKAP